MEANGVDEKAEHKHIVKPSIKKGLLIYFVYLAVFFSVWLVTGVNYPEIGKTVESTKLHYALPTVLASLVVAVIITKYRWWNIVLFDKEKSGPKWAWLGAIAMFLLAIGSFARVQVGGLNLELVFWSLAGAIGVGFGEEMINRGTLLVGLRTRYREGKVWFFSTLAFASLHLPNMVFGAGVLPTLGQFVFAFIVGSLLYSVRRLSGTLILAMVLHGLWDSSIFLPSATGVNPWAIQAVIYPLAIVCAGAVIWKNRGKTVQKY